MHHPVSVGPGEPQATWCRSQSTRGFSVVVLATAGSSRLKILFASPSILSPLSPNFYLFLLAPSVSPLSALPFRTWQLQIPAIVVTPIAAVNAATARRVPSNRQSINRGASAVRRRKESTRYPSQTTRRGEESTIDSTPQCSIDYTRTGIKTTPSTLPVEQPRRHRNQPFPVRYRDLAVYVSARSIHCLSTQVSEPATLSHIYTLE